MSYYTGDLNKLLKNVYVLFKYLGFDPSIDCMIPASRLGPFYKECGLNQNFDKDDLNPIVRHLKLQLLLDI